MRPYWWVVLLVVSLALLGAVLSTVRTPMTYVGRTSLIVSSNDRSPEQDAVLVQGYAAYFDDDSYQQQLLSQAKVDPGATVTAQAAAASPILVITVTSADAERAQTDAIAVAQAFRSDINDVRARATAAELATLQDQLDTALAQGSKADQALVANLQNQVRQLQDDRVNVLQELQARGGVSAQGPSWGNNLLLGLVGGLFAGVLAALALAKLSPRLRSRHDVIDKVGLDTLVELPLPRVREAALLREQQVRRLANLMRARLGGPGVVSIAQPRQGLTSWPVAHELAREWAGQGYATVLVRLGSSNGSFGSSYGETSPDRLAQADPRAALERLGVGPVPGLSVLDLRPEHLGGPENNLPASRVGDLLELEQLAGYFVVIDTPAVLDSAAAQAASRAAGATVLVLDPQQARVTEAREAADVLRQAGAVLLGVVLAPPVEDQNLVPDSELADDNAGQRGGAEQNGDGPRGGSAWSWWPASGRSSEVRRPWGSAKNDPSRAPASLSTPGAAE